MLTLNSLLDRTVRLWGDRLAMIDEDRQLTWKQFQMRVASASGVLAGRGIRRSERFALVAQNSVRQAELMYAGFRIGAIPVPINYRLAAREIMTVLEDSGSKLLIIDRTFAHLLDGTELASWKGRSLRIDAPVDHSTCQYEAEMLTAALLAPEMVQEEDDAILLYTGGTTGRSKGVRLTHRNLATVALQNAAKLAPRCDDIYLHVAPMFHSADLLGNAYLACGAAHRYLAKPTAHLVLETIEKQGITATVLPPTILILVLQEDDFSNFDLSSLRTLVFGSAPMIKTWIITARDAIPSMELWQGYGLTETSQMLTLDRVPTQSEIAILKDDDRVRSAGRALIGTDLVILDDNGREQPAGAIGEVVVRGPQIAKGYLNMPEETDRQFRNGWFYTGDLGCLDSDGFLYLHDRKKDMVITGGENVYSFEVEEALVQHPDVMEAAVFGVPDVVYGESLMAVIIPRSGSSICAGELIEHCRSLIGGYKIPRRIVFSGELPKNSLGKIVKSQLRQRYAKSTGAQDGQA
jgi:long-chain acyl-CoA synthetase